MPAIDLSMMDEPLRVRRLEDRFVNDGEGPVVEG